MTEYLGRSAWADSDWRRGGARLTGGQLVGIAWHWPGTSQNVIGDPGRAAIRRRLRSYWNYHVNTRGWSDIGYNHAIDQAGRVWDLRGLGRVGAHCASAANPDANHEWMGVLLIVGDEEEPSGAMIEAAQDFRRDVFLERWSGRERMTGHGRAPGVPGARTSCPGSHVAELIVDGTFEEEGDVATARDVWSFRWKWRTWIAERFPGTAERWPNGYTMKALVQNTYGYARDGARRVWRRRLPWWGSWDERWPDLAERFPDGYSAEALQVHQYGHSRAGREEVAELRQEVRDLFAAQQPLLEAAAEGRTITAEEAREIAEQIEAITAADVIDRIDVDVTLGVDDADPATDEPDDDPADDDADA